MAWHSYSGLTYTERKKARSLTLQAAYLGLHRAPSLHYTQGPERWQGINEHLKAWKGQCPTEADCSSFLTWCLWNGLDHFGVHDIVNGAAWKAGYTGTLLQHGRTVARFFNACDAAIYGQKGSNGEHTALLVSGTHVISNGSEPGPYFLPLHYRPDLMCVKRFI